MTAATWAQVHVGDTVRGADQRPWQVVARGERSAYVAAGERAWFRLQLGERETTIERRLAEPCELVSITDRAEATAVQALIDGGLAVALIEETKTPVTTVADPAPAPTKLDRWNRYVLPDPETGTERAWTRATTVARTLADEFNLTQWKLRTAAKGLALRPDLIAGAAAADPDEDKGTLNSIVDKAMEAASGSKGANYGTALHTFTQRLDRGEALSALGAPAPLDADLAAYAAGLKAHGLATHPDWLERIVALPELGVAGTLDRILAQRSGVTKSGPLAIGDLKTGKTLDFSWLEIAIQLALYSRAPYIWNARTRAWERMPEVDQTRGLVIHLPIGKATPRIYGVDLVKGWAAAVLALKVREARAASKQLSWLVEPSPADLAWHRVTIAQSRADLAAVWEWAAPQGLWTDELAKFAQLALADIESGVRVSR